MITNEAGQVAMAYHQPAQAYAGNMPSGGAYVFTVQRSVSLAWVDPGDVDALLAKRGGCCGKRNRLFSYATEGQVSIWTNGARGPGGNGAKPCGC